MASGSIIKFISSTCFNELKAAIQEAIQEGAQGLLLLTCSNNNYNKQQVDSLLKECFLPIGGGVFPKIIVRDKSYVEGALVIGLKVNPKIVNYTMLTSNNANLKNYIHDRSGSIKDYQNFIIIADALCDASEYFTDEFYDYIGSDATTIGGGAGSLDFLPQNVIYSNQGLIGDAVQVIALPTAITNGVGHGWEILDGPYLVTESKGHYIHSLNYKPTFELYRDAIKKNTQQILTKDVFFELAKNFPLGLVSLDGELFVRDPIQTNGSYLQCVGNVPVNSMLYLLKGKTDKMIMAAGKTAEKVANQRQSNNTLLFDCISRDLFMGDEIQSELQEIQRHFPATCLVGAMTLGEIVNSESGAIRFLNKSTVLGTF